MRTDWLRQIIAWCGDGALPGRSDVGLHYPWRAVALHARSRAMDHKITVARRALDAAAAVSVGWCASLSGGKDSSAMAALLALHGWHPPAVSVKDDLDYPGERAYIEHLCRHLGLHLDILSPGVSLWSVLAGQRSLLNDHHGRTAELSAEHFYGLLNAHRLHHGYDGALLGLRAGESRGRAMNATRGSVYRRKDGLTVAQPIAAWSALDVHAFLVREQVPLLPCYLCVDPGMDALSLRKSWWVVGGLPATIGSHYAWLRRWWPDLWQLAADIDPAVRAVS
jgi:3'-phosphoadenosine 5'-phosphosulfate sulfotransferase (PAPS reductase)/FAD synthetase